MIATNPPPRASVVLPVRDEEPFVGAALGAVLVQDLPDGALEVLVVDGRSSDRTREIVGEMAQGARFPVRLLDNPGRIAASALNIGVAEARAEVVVRVDGHAEIPTDYVRRLLEVLESSGAEVAGGTVCATAPEGGGPWAAGIQCAMRSRLGDGGAAFRRLRSGTPREADTVGFPAYRKHALAAVGGFDESLVRNQDDDLHLRLREKGARLVLVPDLVVTYRCRERLGDIFRQYAGYGFWKVVCARRHGRLTSGRAWAPTLLVLFVVLSVVAGVVLAGAAVVASDQSLASSVVGTALLAAFVVAVANLVWLAPLEIASVWFLTPRPEPEGALPSLRPEIALVTMYLGYGLGFWRAVLRGGRPPRRAA